MPRLHPGCHPQTAHGAIVGHPRYPAPAPAPASKPNPNPNLNPNPNRVPNHDPNHKTNPIDNPGLDTDSDSDTNPETGLYIIVIVTLFILPPSMLRLTSLDGDYVNRTAWPVLHGRTAWPVLHGLYCMACTARPKSEAQ